MQEMDGTRWIVASLVLVLLLNMMSVADFDGVPQRSTENVLELEREGMRVGGTTHAPIIIDGDTNFSATVLVEGWSGNGSHANPYVIESLDIDHGGSAEVCINIINTRVHFIVRNCVLTGANVSPGSGLHLNNVTNGEIINNICTNNSYGIVLILSNSSIVANNTCTNSNNKGVVLSSSSSNTVTNNTCTNNNYGVTLSSTSINNVVTDNTCTSNNFGITLGSTSKDNVVTDNTCNSNNYGIVTSSSTNNTMIVNNTCNDNLLYGIYVLLSSSNTVVNNTCTNNTQYGIFIEAGYYNVVVNNTCSSNQFGVMLTSGVNSTVANNICTNNYDSGIHLLHSRSNTMVNNTCRDNIQYGIYIDASNFNTVANNTCSNNNYGVFLITANSNIMINNTCSNNDYGIFVTLSGFNILTNNTYSNNQYGIYLFEDAAENDIQWNVLTDNSLFSGYDNGTNNIFDYNYWSDYAGTDVDLDGFGDAAYVFLANSDPHPLMYLPTLPKWTKQPVDQIVNFGQPFRYDLNVTSPSPLTLWLNDTLFYIDDQGVVTSRAILFIDTYGLRVVVTNIYGSRLTVTFRVNVLDTTSPDWLIIPTDQTLSYDEGFDYQIAVIDISGIDHWELSDTVHFTFTATHYSMGSTVRITNITVLETGEYSLEIRAYDMYHNNCSATIVVTILESMTTATTTPTTPTTSQPEDDSTLVIVVGVGIIGATAILVILVWLRKRGGE